MFKRFLYFIKYNNFAVYIILLIFVLGTGVFAQSESGQDFIGKKNISHQGVDNSLLLEFDDENFDMDFKIENIEEDAKYYYVTYTFLDLILADNVWKYEIQEKIRKISKKSRVDLGEYLAEEMGEQYNFRVNYLNIEKEKAKIIGATKREKVIAYDGLIGRTLVIADKIFPGYEAIKKEELPSPNIPATILSKINKQENNASSTVALVVADNITEIYNEFIQENDPDNDDIFGSIDNCPNDYNPLQIDEDENGVGDICEYEEDLDLEIDKNASSSIASSSDSEQNKQATSTDLIIKNQDQSISTSSNQNNGDKEEELSEYEDDEDDEDNKNDKYDEGNDDEKLSEESVNSNEVDNKNEDLNEINETNIDLGDAESELIEEPDVEIIEL